MQCLVTLILNNLYGVQMRTNNNDSFYCKSETWLKKKYYENVLDYLNLPNGKYIVKIKKDDGLDDGCEIKNDIAKHFRRFYIK